MLDLAISGDKLTSLLRRDLEELINYESNQVVNAILISGLGRRFRVVYKDFRVQQGRISLDISDTRALRDFFSEHNFAASSKAESRS